MKSKCAVLILTLCLTLATASYSLADSGDCEAYTEQFLRSNGFLDHGLITPNDYALMGDTFYTHMGDDQVYTWTPGDAKASLRYSLPKLPDYSPESSYKDLSDKIKADLDNVVFNLVPYDGKLYAFNVISGKFGEIGDNGILWNEVRLDTSLLLQSGSSYPSSICRPFICQGKLYGYYDFSWQNTDDIPSKPIIMVFDLTTGKCTTVDVPGTLDICMYKPGYALLLQKGGASPLVMKEMALDTGEISDFKVEIHVQLDRSIFDDSFNAHYTLGGLAYNTANDKIAFTLNRQVWISSKGTPFAPAANLPADVLTPNTKAWFLSDGRYAIQGAGIHVLNID